MTRRCAVFGCDNTEISTTETIYRFPKDKEAANQWKDSLKLKEFPVELLQTRFGVCDLHFRITDFEQMEEETNERLLLKATAIPTLTKDKPSEQILGTSLGISVEGTNETVISPLIMAPTNANIALLQPLSSLSKPYRTRSMEFSTASTAGNTDISILRTHESHYDNDDDDEEDDDDNFAEIRERNRFTAERLQQSIDAPDFTVVSCALDESTEILRFHTIKAQSQNGYSGTDSDIEVLMSEEINDTEWSAALENLENNALEMRGKHDDCSIEAILAHSMEEHIVTSPSPRRLESTEHDCSVAEFSRQSTFDGAGLSREQLVNVVREQRVRIRELESTLNRYRDAQHALFEHVDAMRMEFAPTTSLDLDKSHITLD